MKHLASILYLLSLAFTLFADFGLSPLNAESIRPNIVLIMADDMGYSDLPRFGRSEIPTPNLSRLADEGTIFTDAYVTAPVCLPSRMGLMTGRYQQRYGIYGNVHGLERHRLFLEETLLPELFQREGYATGHVGKWHLSGNDKTDWMYPGPHDRGFDSFVGITGGGSAYWKGAKVFRDDTPFEAPDYLTDFFGSEACKFIENNKNNPFFLYLAFNAVHAPLEALDTDQDKFSNVENEYRRIYNGMLFSMDKAIGNVLQKLDQLNLTDNTLVIFLNDNGGGGSDPELFADHSRNYANNLPLRGYKFDVSEGGIRVPMIMRWPGHIPEKTVYREMVSSLDVFPTVTHAANIKLPQSHFSDGVNLMPYVTGVDGSKPHEWLCWQNRSRFPYGGSTERRPKNFVHSSAIRMGSWKILREEERLDSKDPVPSWQLYDLSNDIGEERDLAGDNTDIVNRMNDHFNSWRSSMEPSRE